ncbi:MAG: YmdB family metallophosphoesterase, partial [Clostridia bacterium]|nr:YmdB family metallophosphoesterase [Clostridia bacterium]
MRLLAIGDVCGSLGCQKVMRVLPNLKKELHIDAVVINGENAADGNGITKDSALALFAAGADVITGGNHSLRRREVYAFLDENDYLLRPHNLPDTPAGKGYCFLDLGFTSVAVLNLCGRVYMEKQQADNPFKAADHLLEQAKAGGARFVVVDFHAEATSEKRALGLYLDGRVSAFWGTHTHVQTADEQILPGGTGYLTDLGMTGPIHSILGVKSEIIINRLKEGKTDKFE